MHHPCLGGSSVASSHPHFHQQACKPQSSLSTPCPPQCPSLRTSVQWVCEQQMGLCLLASWDCAELSDSPSFLFLTSWVVLGPHLRVRKGRKTDPWQGESSCQAKSPTVCQASKSSTQFRMHIHPQACECPPYTLGSCLPPPPAWRAEQESLHLMLPRLLMPS